MNCTEALFSKVINDVRKLFRLIILGLYADVYVNLTVLMISLIMHFGINPCISQDRPVVHGKKESV